MNYAKAIFLFLLLQNAVESTCQIHDSIALILQNSIDHAKEASLYTNEVDWDSLEVVIKSHATNATSIEELNKAFTVLINGLRDHHGKIIYNNEYLSYFTDHENSRSSDFRKREDAIWQEVNYNTKHGYELLENGVGYIRIVGIGPNPEKFGIAIRQGIDSIAALGAQRWVLDLRYNGGGNMHPMVEALTPFLKDGIVGYDASLEGKITGLWEIKNRHFFYNQYNMIEIEPAPYDFSNSKVVVLTSRYTISSGEVVATIFSGRPNTYFVGEPTGGYTTVTNYHSLNENLFMSIAVSIYCNRDKQVFYDNIPVDLNVPFVVEYNWQNDQGIIEAINWLQQ